MQQIQQVTWQHFTERPLPPEAASVISQLNSNVEDRIKRLHDEQEWIIELQAIFTKVTEDGTSFRCMDVLQARNFWRKLNQIVTNLDFHHDTSELGIEYRNMARFITGIEKLIGNEITILFEFADSYPVYSTSFQYNEPVNFIICRTSDLWKEMETIHNRR